MTTTDELGRRVAVLINLHQRGTDLGPTVDTIIRLVVDACARGARKAGTYERRVWDGVWREYDEVTEEVAGLEKIIAAIRELAPKEPAP